MPSGRGLARLAAASAASLSLLGCQTIVLGAPRFPPCYLDSEAREAEADRLQVELPASYEWVRRVDAICMAWTEDAG